MATNWNGKEYVTVDITPCYEDSHVSSGIGKEVPKLDLDIPQDIHGSVRGLGSWLSSTPVCAPSHLNAVPENSGDNTIQQLTDLFRQLGQQISNSIVTQLSASGIGTHNNTPCPTSDNAANNSLGSQLSGSDLSKLSLVVKLDVKEPPIFRGDGTEKCTVREWEELMGVFLKKKGYNVCNYAEEIMNRLLGRARDVVKVGLRSSPHLDVKKNPEIIYNILKQHFGSVTYSSMPLADFYSTLPLLNESVLDYWIRLNKAMDVVEECLERQGKKLENSSHEVAMMFVRHCSDSDLVQIFKSKALEKWTMNEVQERIDEHQRERRRKANCLASVEQIRKQNCALVESGEEHLVRRVAQDNPVSCPKLLTSTVQVTSSSESATLERMIGMLERVLEKSTLGPSRPPQLWQNQRRPNRGCLICSDQNHTTHQHCIRHRLCFRCYGSGHRKEHCPQIASSLLTPQDVTGNAGDLLGN